MTWGPHRNAVAATVLAGLALLLFARLTLRHVGDSYFLADQVDQLQKYEAALRLDPEGLWGPAMSGTAARALGPIGALVFGLPVSLGFGIDGIHAFTSMLLVLATAIALWQLARLNMTLAWCWLIVFTAMRMVWWNAAMFWVNTLLLPLGLMLFALSAVMVRRPSLATLAAMALVLVLALHIHLAAIVGLPLLFAAAAHRRRRSPLAIDAGSPGITTLVCSLIALAVLPYLVAEARTGFQNTRAMISHVEAASTSNSQGSLAALETLTLAADPMELFPGHRTGAVVLGSLVTLAALALLVWRRRRSPENTATLWLLAAGIVAVAGQALFFLVMARPLNGLHYAIVLAPWYALPLAALAAASFSELERRWRRQMSVALGVAAVILLIVRGPVLADRFAERTPWNYQALVLALDTLCAGEGVETVEGPGLVNELTPAYDSVLRYLLKRGLTRCRYQPGSEIVVAANRASAFDEILDVNGRIFVREQTLPPGLARYRNRP